MALFRRCAAFSWICSCNVSGIALSGDRLGTALVLLLLAVVVLVAAVAVKEGRTLDAPPAVAPLLLVPLVLAEVVDVDGRKVALVVVVEPAPMNDVNLLLALRMLLRKAGLAVNVFTPPADALLLAVVVVVAEVVAGGREMDTGAQVLARTIPLAALLLSAVTVD